MPGQRDFCSQVEFAEVFVEDADGTFTAPFTGDKDKVAVGAGKRYPAPSYSVSVAIWFLRLCPCCVSLMSPVVVSMSIFGSAKVKSRSHLPQMSSLFAPQYFIEVDGAAVLADLLCRLLLLCSGRATGSSHRDLSSRRRECGWLRRHSGRKIRDAQARAGVLSATACATPSRGARPKAL